MFAAHADGMVLELDKDARIVGLWAARATFFSKPEELLQGQTIHAALAEPQASYFEEQVRSVLATGHPASFDYTVEADEERRVYAANAMLLPAHEGYPEAVTVLVRDVTERSRLQHQVLQSERLASLGVLAAGVAHEINNPLGYMSLNLQRVRRGLLEPAVSKEHARDLVGCLDMTLEGALRVQAIVQDLRRFSRSDPEAPLAEVDVRHVLTFTLEMQRS